MCHELKNFENCVQTKHTCVVPSTAKKILIEFTCLCFATYSSRLTLHAVPLDIRVSCSGVGADSAVVRAAVWPKLGPVRKQPKGVQRGAGCQEWLSQCFSLAALFLLFASQPPPAPVQSAPHTSTLLHLRGPFLTLLSPGGLNSRLPVAPPAHTHLHSHQVWLHFSLSKCPRSFLPSPQK